MAGSIASARLMPMALALPVWCSTRKLVAMPARAVPKALWAAPSHHSRKFLFHSFVGFRVVGVPA